MEFFQVNDIHMHFNKNKASIDFFEYSIVDDIYHIMSISQNELKESSNNYIDMFKEDNEIIFKLAHSKQFKINDIDTLKEFINFINQ